MVIALPLARMWPSRCSVCFWTARASSSRAPRDLPLLHEDVAQAVLEPAGRRVGHHHHAVLEGDGDALLVLLVGQGQQAGLSLQPDELEDVGQAEVADRPFERHRLPRRRRGPGPPRAGRAGRQLDVGLGAEPVRDQPDPEEHQPGRRGQPRRREAPRHLGEGHHPSRHDQRQDPVPGRERAPRRAASSRRRPAPRRGRGPRGPGRRAPGGRPRRCTSAILRLRAGPETPSRTTNRW